MALVINRYVYEFAEVTQPHIVCETTNTRIRLLAPDAITYLKGVSGKVVVVRRSLVTNGETRIAELPADPRQTFAGWTADGSLEVYATHAPSDFNVVGIHLWSGGADHVLYTIKTSPFGFESRWSPTGVARFSRDGRYLAVSYPAFDSLRIFSVADRREVLEAKVGASFGGTWLANDAFIWANTDAVRQWTPVGGTTVLRQEHWYGPVASPDGAWLAGTLLTEPSNPHVMIASLRGGRTFDFALAAGPEFVSSNLLLFAAEGPCPPQYGCGADPTTPTRQIHAFDPATGNDQMIGFNAGEEPLVEGGHYVCCASDD